MAVLAQLQESLNSAAQLFGGYEEVARLLPERELQYIASYPGAVFATSTWSYLTTDKIDLRSVGYEVENTYKLYNKDFELVYSGKRDRDLVYINYNESDWNYTDGSYFLTISNPFLGECLVESVSNYKKLLLTSIEFSQDLTQLTLATKQLPISGSIKLELAPFFGELLAEREIIQNAYHGEYFHLEVNNSKTKKLALVWVASELSELARSQLVQQYQNIYNQTTKTLTTNYIGINIKGLEKPVKVISVEGIWSDNYSLNQILSHPNRQISEINSNLISLYPNKSIWYVFIAKDGSLLLADNFTGSGSEQWQSLSSGVHFLNLNSRYRGTRSIKERPITIGKGVHFYFDLGAALVNETLNQEVSIAGQVAEITNDCEVVTSLTIETDLEFAVLNDCVVYTTGSVVNATNYILDNGNAWASFTAIVGGHGAVLDNDVVIQPAFNGIQEATILGGFADSTFEYYIDLNISANTDQLYSGENADWSETVYAGLGTDDFEWEVDGQGATVDPDSIRILPIYEGSLDIESDVAFGKITNNAEVNSTLIGVNLWIRKENGITISVLEECEYNAYLAAGTILADWYQKVPTLITSTIADSALPPPNIFNVYNGQDAGSLNRNQAINAGGALRTRINKRIDGGYAGRSNTVNPISSYNGNNASSTGSGVVLFGGLALRTAIRDIINGNTA